MDQVRKFLSLDFKRWLERPAMNHFMAAYYEPSICRAAKHELENTGNHGVVLPDKELDVPGVPELKVVGLPGNEHEVAGVHEPSSWFTWQRVRSSWCT
jgi:hypothetical protein